MTLQEMLAQERYESYEECLEVCIQNLMQSLSCTLEEAKKLLNISPDDIAGIKRMSLDN